MITLLTYLLVAKVWVSDTSAKQRERFCNRHYQRSVHLLGFRHEGFPPSSSFVQHSCGVKRSHSFSIMASGFTDSHGFFYGSGFGPDGGATRMATTWSIFTGIEARPGQQQRYNHLARNPNMSGRKQRGGQGVGGGSGGGPLGKARFHETREAFKSTEPPPRRLALTVSSKRCPARG